MVRDKMTTCNKTSLQDLVPMMLEVSTVKEQNEVEGLAKMAKKTLNEAGAECEQLGLGWV